MSHLEIINSLAKDIFTKFLRKDNLLLARIKIDH